MLIGLGVEVHAHDRQWSGLKGQQPLQMMFHGRDRLIRNMGWKHSNRTRARSHPRRVLCWPMGSASPFRALALRESPRREFAATVAFPRLDPRLGPGWRVTCKHAGLEVMRSKEREEPMKSSTKDRVQGKWRESKGKIKETVGWTANRPDLAAEGVDEKAAGAVQKTIGQVKKVLGK